MKETRRVTACLAAWLAAAMPAMAEPARLPASVSAVSITANGARGDDVSGDETAATCARFRLRVRDVRAFFRLARPVDERAYYHDLKMSRCRAEGRVTFADGRRGRWRIDRERRGLVLLPGRAPVLLHCPRCTTRAFEPIWDPERGG